MKYTLGPRRFNERTRASGQDVTHPVCFQPRAMGTERVSLSMFKFSGRASKSGARSKKWSWSNWIYSEDYSVRKSKPCALFKP